MSESKAAKADATGEPVGFEWQGEEWSATAPSAWPIDALEAYEEEKVVRFLKLVVGEADFARLKKGRTVEDLTGFVSALQEALGLGN